MKKGSRSLGVSIVIPYAGRNLFLEQALSSIFSQTYPGEIQIIVACDSAFPDSYYQLLDHSKSLRLPKNMELTIVLSKRISGPGPTRNAGIEVASMHFLGFLDDDDIYLPNKIQRQVGEMIRLGSDFSYHSFQILPGNKQARVFANRAIIVSTKKLQTRLLFGVAKVATPSVMLRRESFDVSKGIFPEDAGQLGEDFLCWARLLSNCSLPIYLTDPLVFIRNSQNSVRGRIAGSNFEALLRTQLEVRRRFWLEAKELGLNPTLPRVIRGLIVGLLVTMKIFLLNRFSRKTNLTKK